VIRSVGLTAKESRDFKLIVFGSLARLWLNAALLVELSTAWRIDRRVLRKRPALFDRTHCGFTRLRWF
jgi:hypothetical protein